MADAPKKTLADLIDVMAALRTPVTGCPWDLEQTFATIAPYTIEEAYEVADAIARDDKADLKEELGDLLLQVVYHAQLANEEGAFDFTDVAHGITTKMIRRHPHVFGDEEARSAGMAKGAWERIKAEEKAEKVRERTRLESGSRVDNPGQGARAPVGTGQPKAQAKLPSLLSDVPIGLPGMTRAVKLQEKAARVGFDWPSLAPVFDKVREEIAELEDVALPADPRGKTQERGASSPSHSPARDAIPGPDLKRVEEEFGDLLFVMANVARHLAIDPENALRAANAKFTRRFAHIEARLAEQGTTPAQSNLAEMDALWNDAKRAEKPKT